MDRVWAYTNINASNIIRDSCPKGQSELPRDPPLSEVDSSETAMMK